MTTEAKVGAFVIASLLILGTAAYFIHTTQTVRGQVPYTTHLQYAGGLAPISVYLRIVFFKPPRYAVCI